MVLSRPTKSLKANGPALPASLFDSLLHDDANGGRCFANAANAVADLPDLLWPNALRSGTTTQNELLAFVNMRNVLKTLDGDVSGSVHVIINLTGNNSGEGKTEELKLKPSAAQPSLQAPPGMSSSQTLLEIPDTGLDRFDWQQTAGGSGKASSSLMTYTAQGSSTYQGDDMSGSGTGDLYDQNSYVMCPGLSAIILYRALVPIRFNSMLSKAARPIAQCSLQRAMQSLAVRCKCNNETVRSTLVPTKVLKVFGGQLIGWQFRSSDEDMLNALNGN